MGAPCGTPWGGYPRGGLARVPLPGGLACLLQVVVGPGPAGGRGAVGRSIARAHSLPSIRPAACAAGPAPAMRRAASPRLRETLPEAVLLVLPAAGPVLARS